MKNRANVVASILQSPEVLRSAYESSQNSFGSAEEELNKYMDSINGHIAQLQNKWQQAWSNVANRDQINFFIDMGSAIMDLVNKIGLLPSAVVGLTAVYGTLGVALKKDTNIITLLTSAFQGLGKTAFTIGQDVSEAATVTKSLIEIEDELDDAVEMAADGFMIAGESGATAASAITIPWWGVLAAIAAVTAAIFIAKKAYDEFAMSTDALIKRNEKLIKDDQEKLKSLQEEKKGYDDNVKSLSDLLSRYQEAEVGSEEYYNIRQQIADQFPELIVGYDSEGQAIIATNEQIQAQINKYKELSLAKQEALKDQARENIDREVGLTGRSGVNVAGQDVGNEALSDLISKRRELEQRKREIEQEYAKSGGKKTKTDNKGERAWVETLETDKEYQQVLEDLSKTGEALADTSSSLREGYAALVNDIDEGNEDLVNALSQLETIASKAGMSSLSFESAFERLKKMDLKDEDGITNAFNQILNPDFSKIKASDYRAQMSKYVGQIGKAFNMSADEINNLREQADIKANADYIEKARQELYDNNYQKALQAGYQDQLLTLYKEGMVSDILGWNPDDFYGENFKNELTTKYSSTLEDIKNITKDDLKDIDWNENLTDPALKAIRGIAQMLEGKGIISGSLEEQMEQTIDLLSQQEMIAKTKTEEVVASFQTFSTNYEQAQTQLNNSIEKSNTALSEQSKQGYISADTYKELIAANSNYKDAIIETATGIQLNTDKVKELQKQEKESLADKLAKEQKELYTQYSNNETEIARLTQKLRDHNFVGEENEETVTNQISSLNEAQATLQDNIATWGLYRDQLLAATNAWNEWQTAQSTANASDPYKSMKSAWDSFAEAHEQGWVGTDDYLSYARLLTGVTDEDVLMSDKLFEQAKKTQERYFTDSVRGVANFLDDAKAMLEQNGLNDWLTEDGGLLIKNDELFTSLFSEYMQGKGMAGMSLEGVQQLLSAVQDAGWGNPEEWGTYADQASYLQDTISWMEEQQSKLDETNPKWKEYGKLIDNAKEQLVELEIAQNQYKTPEELQEQNALANGASTTQVELPTSFASADQAQGVLDQLTQQKAEIDMELNPDAYQACLDEIQYVTGQLMDLQKPVTIDVTAEGLSEAQQQAGQLIEQIQEAKKVEQMALNSGDTEGASAAQGVGNKAAEELMALQQQNPKLELGIEIQEGTMDEVYGQLTEHAEEVKEAFKIDDNVMSGVIKSIDDTGASADTAKGKVNDLGTAISSVSPVSSLGFPSLNGWISTAKTNVGRLQTAINNLKDKTVKVRVQTSNTATGVTGAQGTTKFHPFGKAAASGDMGAKKTETALVGELGPEMRVRGSRWELLGENGAEFANVRKGDIIFNHKQTAELLKNGYISSRGQMAFVGGTAFAGKSKDWQKSDNYKRAKGSSDSTTKKTKDKTKTKTKTKNSDSDKDTKSKESALKKWLDKLFDWIEVKLDRIQKKIDISTKKAEMFTDMIPATLDRITKGANELFDANRYKATADEVARYVSKAMSSYTEALSSTYEQIGVQNQAVSKYNKKANQAEKKGLAGLSSKNKKTAKKALKILDDGGEVKISEYNDKVKEVIEGVKQWKDKALEAKSAIHELNSQVRQYVQSLKEVVDKQREAHTTLSEWSISTVNAGFEATNDANYNNSVSRLRFENTQLGVQNAAYSRATTTMTSSVNDLGKTALGTGKYDGLTKAQKKALKKNKSGLAKYEKALNNAKTAIKGNKEITLADLNTIQEYNPTVYAKMIAWNEGLNQLDITRQEEITAYAENLTKISDNIRSKYSKMDEAVNNEIDLYGKQIDNALQATSKNELLQNQINDSYKLLDHRQQEVVEFAKQVGNNKITLQNFGSSFKNVQGIRSITDSDKKIIEPMMVRIQAAVKKGEAISAPDLNTVMELARKGYISQAYYQACLNWQDSVESYNQAVYAQKITDETIRQENATRALQKIQNIQQQGEYDRQLNNQRKTEAQARISKADAYGHYAKAADYTVQIEKENDNLQNLIAKREEARKSLEESIRVGNIHIGDDEWWQATQIIDGMTNSINETDLSIKNLANDLRQLEWTIFDDGMKEVHKLNTEIEHYLNIISNEEFFNDDDRGNITQFGLAALEAHNTALELNIQQARKYADELQNVQDQIAKKKLDPTDSKVRERVEELTESMWSFVEATESEKQTIIGLVKQGYDSQLSALNKSISKYKELKDAEKEAYDYQKKIADQTKNITNLQKQLAAFEGNTSAESVATVQKLRADLKEAQQQRTDDQYDKYLSDSSKMLDDLSNNFQEWIDYYMKDRNQVLNDAKEFLAGSIDDLGETSGMATAVATFREQAVDLIGQTNTDVTNVSTTLTSLLGENGSVTAKTNAIATDVRDLLTNFDKMVKEQVEPMVKNLSTVVAQANGTGAYDKAAAEAKKAEEAARAKREAEVQAKLGNTSVGTISGGAAAAIKTTSGGVSDAQKRQNIAKLTTEIATLQTQLQEQEAKLQKLANDKDSLNRQKLIKGNNNKSLNDKIANKNNEIKSVENLIKNITNDIKAKQTALKSYRKGSHHISANQLAFTQEDGTEVIYRASDHAMLTPLNAGDKVFTAQMSENLWKMAQINLPEMIAKSFKQPVIANNSTSTQAVGDVQFVFNLPGVTDYDSFKTALIADKNFQNAVQSMTLGAVSGKNSLSKFKYS